MVDYYSYIDNQLQQNKGLNFFSTEKNPFKISENFIAAVRSFDGKHHIFEYAIDKVLNEFHRVNQYYSFDAKARNELKKIYENSFVLIKSNELTEREISDKHFYELKSWLKKSNPFAEKIYSESDSKIEPVACYEYSPELQMNILQLNIAHILEPVLDIGCGSEANLVNYLRGNGIEAYGIDRSAAPSEYLENADWLSYNFGVNRWGMVVSNLGFSNHFMHHHLREDGDYLIYANKYMEILRSIKKGGSFHYAPDLPFIEQYLPENKYQIRNYSIKPDKYKSTIVKIVG